MKIVIAPDSYKGSLTSIQVAEGIANGLRSARPDAELVLLPLADGGEGTTQSIIAATGGQWRHCIVTGPLGKPVEAAYGILPDGSGIAEMASASGIEYLDREELDPLHATTFGTGELIRSMLDEGIRDITLGIGGSATVDGGAGMAQALGFRLLDETGNELHRGGAALAQLRKIDIINADPRLLQTRFRVACDVTNPLLGESGAAHVFGPQKGATPKMVEELEAALATLSRVWKEQNLLDTAAPGDGAAGGLGAGLRAFCNAKMFSGAHLLLDVCGFDKLAEDADFIITGEGCTDASTASGKLPSVVAEYAKQRNIPCILIAGVLHADLDTLNDTFTAAFGICQKLTSLDEAIATATGNLEFTARNVGALL